MEAKTYNVTLKYDIIYHDTEYYVIEAESQSEAVSIAIEKLKQEKEEYDEAEIMKVEVKDVSLRKPDRYYYVEVCIFEPTTKCRYYFDFYCCKRGSFDEDFFLNNYIKTKIDKRAEMYALHHHIKDYTVEDYKVEIISEEEYNFSSSIYI